MTYKSDKRLVDNKNRDWITLILAIINLQILVDVAILLDVPIARQVLGFIYLTIVPGMILLLFFKLPGLDSAEKFLFSVGLSVVFSLVLGLMLNVIGLLFQVAILSTPILLLAMNSTVSFLCVLCFLLNKNRQRSKEKIDFSLPLVLSVCLPILAILGTTLANFNGNSVILLLLIGTVALAVLIGSIRSGTSWPFILLMISVAILLHGSLVSNYIVGYDVHPAYYVFENTRENGIWNLRPSDAVVLRTSQMLSVTIFPAIYAEILDLEGTWIFKIVYPMIFALVPVGLYQLYQKYMEKKAAFVATFVILAGMTFFYELPGLPTQMISELFLVLSLLVVFHRKISPTTKMLFFTIFSVGMIVSHYGISYVFLILIFFSWFVSFIRKKQSVITLTHVVLFVVMAFSWYIYTSQSASFVSLVEMGENIQRNFWDDLLAPSARPGHVLRAVGVGEPATSIGHWFGRGFHYLVQFFIVLGVVIVVLKRKTSDRFDHEYVVMSLAMLVFVLLPLVAPSFNLLNVTRTYHISLLLLAPFCVIGGNSFFSFFLRFRRNFAPFFLTTVVVASLFLFETGFVYEITGDTSYSISLSRYRIDRVLFYGVGYLTESVDVSATRWVRSNIVLTANTLIYADVVSVSFPLMSYAVFPRAQTEILTNATSFDRTNAYVYLRKFNTIDGKIFGRGYVFGHVWNTSDLSSSLIAFNKIYTNGGSEIFFTLRSDY
ncbi:DUF2206 domain-containing protein [Candidatus Bathyarchaeota archaeon]|nr:DUF2206 domain-containing protein [Candidatus Bathyarchaeota archaeon]